MKQFFAITAACLVALLLFALVVTAALIVIPELLDNSSDKRDARARTVKPQGFKFIEHQRVDAADTFTVRGVVQNSSAVTWNYPSIKLRLLSNGKVVTICDGMAFGNMKPMSKRSFLVECKETQTPASGQLYQYELFVDDAMQDEG